MIQRMLVFLLALTVLFAAHAPSARSADIKVWSAGAVKSAVSELFAQFEAAHPHKVVVQYATAGVLRAQLTKGETADVVILPDDVMNDAEAGGRIASGTRAVIGRVGIGVAVHANAKPPDISTPEAFKRTLLAAKSVVQVDPTRGTSGRYLAQLFDQMGIADAMKPKMKYLEGGYVVEPVGRGEVELGLHQISEILPVPNLRLVGPLPAVLQKVSIYEIALMNQAKEDAAGRALIRFLLAPELKTVFTAKGLDYPN